MVEYRAMPLPARCRKLHWLAGQGHLQPVSGWRLTLARTLPASFGRENVAVTRRSSKRFDNGEYSILFRRSFHRGQNLFDSQAVLEIRMERLAAFE